MPNTLVYLGSRLLFRIEDFFHHWYIDGSRRVAESLFDTLRGLDRIFAVRITLAYLGTPLYGDPSLVGRILGILFRSGRIVIGGVTYGVVFGFYLAGYVLYLTLPIGLLLFASRSYHSPTPLLF
jgi:hypothetical protein